MTLAIEQKRPENLDTSWADQIPGEQWALYEKVIDEAQASGVPFLLGGGFALATYSGRWRNTKDMDCYVLPRDRKDMIEILSELGFGDYYDQLPYERHWIYRGVQDDVIVDVIWQMANRGAVVDRSWFSHAPTLDIRGKALHVLAPEEAIWNKIYVLQRDRCDWPDLFNILSGVGPWIDWDRLVARLADDAPLLSGVLAVFGWLCPERAAELPEWLWDRLTVRLPARGPGCSRDRRRIDLLDTRDWFGPSLPPGRPLAV
jgi:putative nucleotidyltransferase-like protein